MPIGSGIVYNTGDLILSQVSSSGTAFLETKIASATSSLIYFDSTARINSASLNSITVGTASYVSGSTSIITNLTASNISASGTGSFGIVGIGTVNPAYKLDVNGNANFTNGFYTNTDASSTSYFVGANGTRPIIFQNNTGASYDFGFKFSDSNTFTIVGGNTLANPTTDLVSFTYDGKVGIGTTVPGTLFQVFKAANGNNWSWFNGNVGANLPTGFTTGVSIGTNYSNGFSESNLIWGHGVSSNQYFAIGKVSGSTSYSEQLRIDINGNVGIGTTSPTARLHVSGSTGGVFEVDTVGGATTLYVTASGNVGIGTIIPIAKLQVAGAGIFASELLNSSSDQIGWVNAKFTDYNDGHGIYISSLQAGGGKWLSGEGRYWNSGFWRSTSTTSTAISLDSGALKFYTNTGLTANSDFQPSERMRINSAGNVGIGTTNPAYLLDVSGSSRHGYRTSDTHFFTGSVNISGSLNATASWANNAVSASYALTSSYSSVSQTANALNTGNSYTITNLTASGAVKAGSAIININGNLNTITGNVTTMGYNLTGSPGNTTAWVTVYTSQNALSSNDIVSQIAYDNYANEKLYTRYSSNSGASWSLWKTVINSDALTGSTNYIPKFTNANTIGNSAIYDSSGNIGIGSSSPSSKFEVLTSAVALANQPNIIGNFRGDTDGRSLIRVDNTSTSAGAAALQSGISFVAYSNVSNQPSANKHEAQIILGSTGATSVTGGQTGTLQIIAPQDIAFNVSASNIIMTGSSYTTFGYNAMYITRAGNIGIGTTNPSSRLHISGSSATAITITDDVLYTNSISNDNSVMTYTVDTGNAAAASAAHVFKRFNTELVRIDPSGNVGIGTTSPSTKLAIEGGSVSAVNVTGSDVRYSFDIRTLVGGAIGFNNAAASNVYGAVTGSAYFGVAQSYPIVFTTAGTERMRIESGGNVGIGTTGPAQKLDVRGYVVSDVGSNAVEGGFYLGNGNHGLRRPGGSSNDVYLYTTSGTLYMGASGNSSQHLTILTGGNVGIGTTSPSNKTTIDADATGVSFADNGVAQLVIRGTTDTTKRLGLGVDTTNNIGVIQAQKYGTAAYPLALNPVGGNVGIGTTSPAYLLDVSGSSRHGYRTSDAHYFTGSVNISGSLNATASWANNVVSASYATTAQTANALNTGNSYTVAGLTSAYVDVTGAGTIPTTGIYRPSTKTLGLSADGTLIFKISNVSAPATSSIETGNFLVSGSVGIGTTNPSVKFHNVGSSILANNTTIDPDTYQNTVIAGAIADGSGWGVSSAIGGNSGTGDSWAIGHNGDNLYMAMGNGSANNTFQTYIQFVANRNLLLVPTSGNVGIGTSSPVQKFHIDGVVGNPATSGTVQNGIVRLSNTTDNAVLDIGMRAGGTGAWLQSTDETSLAANYSLLLNPNGGNVGIGTTDATDKLTVYGAMTSYKTGADTIQTQVYLANGGNTRAFNLQLNSGGTGLDLWSYNSANAWLKHTTFNYDGNVGIGTAAPGAKLEISGSSNSALLNIKSPISGAILYVSGSGAVGIGTTAVGAFTLQVSGSFGATTKSFIIDHPTKAGKKLMYGSLESPYHGIRLTGRDTLVNGKCKIQLPDYMYKLILHDSVNIQLTGIKCNKTLYIDDINIPENYFTIAYDKAIFESYKDYDFFWDFTAIRADVPELQTEM